MLERANNEDFDKRLQDCLQPVDLRRFRVPHVTTPEYYERHLAHLGSPFVMSLIAAGQLPNEVALDLAVPIPLFKKWLVQHTGAGEREQTLHMCAESMLVKAQAVLLMDVDSAQDAAQARAYAKQLTWIAERLDNNQWAPPRTIESDAPPTFSITINKGADAEVEREQVKLRESIIEHGPQTLEQLRLTEG